MTILRNRLIKKFSVVPNQIILDQSISDRALRVYLYLLTKPDNWNVNNKDVMKQLNIKDEGTLSKAWKTLINAGWINRIQLKSSTGTYGGYDYVLNEFPHAELSPTRVLPAPVKSVPGETGVLNNTDIILKTNISNKEKNIKKEILDFNFSDFTKESIAWIKKWLDYKNNILKKPFKTDYAMTKLRNKLLEYQSSDSLVDNIDYSLGKDYKDVYPNPERRYPARKDINKITPVVKDENYQQIKKI